MVHESTGPDYIETFLQVLLGMLGLILIEFFGIALFIYLLGLSPGYTLFGSFILVVALLFTIAMIRGMKNNDNNEEDWTPWCFCERSPGATHDHKCGAYQSGPTCKKCPIDRRRP